MGKIWEDAELRFWQIAMIRPMAIMMNGNNSYYARKFLIQSGLRAVIGMQVQRDGQYVILDQMPDDEIVMVLRIYPPGKWHLIRFRIDEMDKIHRVTELTPDGKIPASEGPKLGTRISTFNELEIALTRPAHKPGRHNSFRVK